jgi:hypothetical protein
MGGIEAARAEFVVMGDADDSYDFGEVPRFLERLRAGDELVQGCRLPRGGGRVMPGAMPFLHYWIGNPLFSTLVRIWFGAPIHDVYCGLRGFRKSLYQRLGQRCTGMEFATEMVIKAALARARMSEVPVTLHRDGRVAHPPHLRTFRDGWTTLRLFLLYSPRWLFLVPGLALMGFGLLGYVVALPGMRIAGLAFDAHTLLVASLALMCGAQSIVFFLVSKAFAITEGLLPPDPRLDRFFRKATLERGLLLAALGIGSGLLLIGIALYDWRLSGFGRLDYAVTMRTVIPGSTLVALGVQTLFSSFTVSMLGLQRK